MHEIQQGQNQVAKQMQEEASDIFQTSPHLLKLSQMDPLSFLFWFFFTPKYFFSKVDKTVKRDELRHTMRRCGIRYSPCFGLVCTVCVGI